VRQLRLIVPQTCTICRHPKRLAIEQALLNRNTYRNIAKQFGTSTTALVRHREHIAGTLARNESDREAARTGTLLQDVRAGEGRAERLYAQAEEILASALKDKDRRTALQAIRTAIDVMGEARGYLELRGELTNELGRDRTTAMMSIQIICPSAPTPELMPRISFASSGDATIEADTAEEIHDSTQDIALRQFP
jgi:hypothetical protein